VPLNNVCGDFDLLSIPLFFDYLSRLRNGNKSKFSRLDASVARNLVRDTVDNHKNDIVKRQNVVVAHKQLYEVECSHFVGQLCDNLVLANRQSTLSVA
jgi:hypothetical protein